MSKKKITLLTGAGFTRNFGGLLGDQIWSLMFSCPAIQENPSMKQQFLDGREEGYESIYGQILELPEDLFNKEKQIIKQSIAKIYSDQEEFILSQKNKFSKILETLGKFIGCHVNNYFTLNHDLFIEKHLINYLTNLKHNKIKFDWPQVPTKIDDHPEYDLQLPKREEIVEISNSGNKVKYIKLHGSYNWFDSETGKNRVIVGGINKERQRKKEPLLDEYSRYFEHCLESSEYILIIGYSFNDKAINDVLERNVLANKLKMIVIDKLIPGGGGGLLDSMLPSQTGPYAIHNDRKVNLRRILASRFEGYYLVDSIYDFFLEKTGKASHMFKILLEKMNLPLYLLD